MKKIILPLLAFCFILIGINVYIVNNKAVETKKIDKIEISSILPEYDKNDLVVKSELIVTGVVEKVLPDAWNNNNNKKPEKITGSDAIYKDAIIKVDRVLKGDLSKDNKVTIRTFGGEYEDFIMEDKDQPTLNEGDQIVAFLISDNTLYNKNKAKDHFIVLGVNQGLYYTNQNNSKNVHEEILTDDLLNYINIHKSEPDKYENLKSDE